jgi:hypothetical protein
MAVIPADVPDAQEYSPETRGIMNKQIFLNIPVADESIVPVW